MAGGGNPQEGLTADPLPFDRKLSDGDVADIAAFPGAAACPGELVVIVD